ncbi:MAG: hypothetical protein IPI59_01770 [Sphingobacteriales bacterium]|jgi:hypothetical protein|nr:hypothetical protein [Sphingobacteriales bacterium]MBP9142501.1 hypothetical protein [Chitinophagales bacterium]MDA0199418.1 hypothetical protein [Bacteroidota bacterium]MBK6890650.1 hypothetical protein [Sphingobacteriales bacterium]MBK7526297.1 hypothetical protein [Sphingobacteriales bacterium]
MFSFRIKNLALALLAIFLIAAAPACKAKYGCPAGDASAMESKKKKNHRTTSLFDKDFEKRKGIRSR